MNQNQVIPSVEGVNIFRNALLLLSLFLCVAMVFWGWKVMFSALVGGLVSVVNFRWMTKEVDHLLGRETVGKQGKIIAVFVGRLVLILATLFAMIQLSFFSLLGGTAGLSIFVLSGMLEALLSLRKG